jgi:hypothetical protein
LGAGGLHRRVRTIAFRTVWTLVGFNAGSNPSRFAMFGCWLASPPGQDCRVSHCSVAGGRHRWVKTIAFRNVPPNQNHRVSLFLDPGGPHRRVKTIAFCNVWALVGLTTRSKPSRFAMFGRWWASPPGQNHRVSQCLDAGGLRRRVTTIAFRCVWVLVGITAGLKPTRLAMFKLWRASPLVQNLCVSHSPAGHNHCVS